MFEGKLTSVLNKLLGEYVHGISAKDLSVAVFKGDVVLKNLRLKTEALNALDLPFAVRSGLVGKLSLQIPWRALGKQPVVATIERLYVVAGFADDVDGTDALTVEERTGRWERAKAELRRRTVDEGESKWLESAAAADGTNDAAMDKDEDAAKGGDGWLAGMLDTVLGNLEVNISKIHVRLEGDLAAAAKDTSNSSSKPDCFAAGVTLESLNVNTVDASGTAAFSVGGLAERMRKSAKIARLAVYFDVGAASIKPAGSDRWENVSPDNLVAAMEPGVGSDANTQTTPEATVCITPNPVAIHRATTRQYLLKPVSAQAVYERRGKKEPRDDANTSAQRIHLRIDLVGATLTSSHLRAVYDTAERIERDARRAPHAHIRPDVAVQSPGGAKIWWRFAFGAVLLRLEERRVAGGYVSRSSTFRIDKVVDTMRARRRYVDAYIDRALVNHPRPRKKNAASKSKSGDSGPRWPPRLTIGDVPVVDEVERTYPLHVCVLFRALAHQQARRRGVIKDADEVPENGGAIGFLRGMFGSSKNKSNGGESVLDVKGTDQSSESSDGEMSEDDWASLNRVFDLEGHVDAAFDATNSLSAASDSFFDPLQTEASVRIGSVSLQLYDDEIKVKVGYDTSGSSPTYEPMKEVLHASLTGLIAGARTYASGGTDARLRMRAVHLDVGGSKILRAAGSRSVSFDDWKISDDVAGSVTARAVADALWDDDDDDDRFEDADGIGSAGDGSDSEGDESAKPPEALSVRFEKLSKKLSRSDGDDDASRRPRPDIRVGVVLAPAYVTLLRAPVEALTKTLSRHKPAQLAEQVRLFLFPYGQLVY